MLSPLLLLGALGAGSGCSIAHPPDPKGLGTGGPEAPAAIELRADWADVEPAVEAAMRPVETAVIRRRRPDADTWVFELRGLTGTPGRLRMVRLEPGEPDPARIRISARVGRFGAPARAHALVGAIADRLERLRGVEVAPLTR